VTGAGRTLLAVLLLALSGAACRAGLAPAPGPRSAPPTVRSLLAEGDRERRNGREPEALEAYRQAVEHDPGSVLAHLRLVALLRATGRGSEARRIYRERAARSDATDAEKTMAERLETNGSSSALRRVYALAAQRAPENPWWPLALAEVEVAEADAWNLRREDAIERGDRPAEKKAFGQARGALVRAQLALRRAEELAPDLAEVDLYRGLLRAVEGDVQAGAAARVAAYRAAQAAYARAVARDPDLVEGWEGLGDVRFRVGDLRESLEAWHEAVKRSPADAQLRESLGVILLQVERYQDAAEQFRQAAVLAPTRAGPWLRLGDAYAEDERWEPALEAYAEAIRRDGSAVESWYKRGAVLEHLGRLGEARAAFERYVEQGGKRSGAVKRRIERMLRETESS
jgi:tetratricopeptide (TPR) repeat protein